MIPFDTATGKQSVNTPYDGHPNACFGLLRPKRGTCQLFADMGLVDGSVIDSCQRGQRWPLYRQVGESMD